MKQFACAVLAFVAGIVVGTAGSDDSLLEESRQQEASAYDRGYADASSKLKAEATERGLARWEYDPHTGRRSQFVWSRPGGEKDLDYLARESFAVTGWPDQRDSRTP